ncbi:MAG: 50S ribosomal protein L13 [Candidatus Paraimprobicoccus trichonymphae]|uniref:Large ribosomal subunit protein uL13 n=1 Tax=Candidatus Paraimprobicoccus trichonymphae TaxID=3033793 RepID=A0AA48HX66_9FIRM|nr:MAG: 50S ribosomal protein L13 [Candidatus Paraimprobicoccus trichonymphae]
MTKTFMPNNKNIEHKWFIIDAKGKIFGRVASQAAILLRGKHKINFVPHVDCGDNVIIINCSKAILTGKKLSNKRKYRTTGYVGHLKTIKYDDLMKNKPDKAMFLAVKGMIPNNSLGRKELLRLRLVSGSEHQYQAQCPEVV